MDYKRGEYKLYDVRKQIRSEQDCMFHALQNSSHGELQRSVFADSSDTILFTYILH